MWSLSACQGSQCCYLTSGIKPTGNVLCGSGLWEFCGRFDLDREQQLGKVAATERDQRGFESSRSDYCSNEGGVFCFVFCFVLKAFGRNSHYSHIQHLLNV